MTDNEIIKALQCCIAMSGKGCAQCPYHKYFEECRTKRNNDCIDLLNRQKAEVERLNKECDSKEKSYNEEYCLRKEIKAENEKLREAIISNNLTPTAYKVMKENDEKHIHIINGLKAEVERLTKSLDTIADQIKTEFYREFDELIPSIMADKIDKIVKECKGDIK